MPWLLGRLVSSSPSAAAYVSEATIVFVRLRVRRGDMIDWHAPKTWVAEKNPRVKVAPVRAREAAED
jgi:hypothetical protein